MDSEYLGLQSSFTNGVKALVVIKVGADGSLNGYHNKYSLMAEQINATLGYAVLVISNPSKLDIQHNFDLTMQLVQKVYTEISSDIGKLPQIFYLGISRGAAMAAMLGWQYPLLNNLLLVNPPLMINWHKLKTGLLKFKGNRITVVIGEKDPSYKYSGLI
ncbi:MAG: hypothetical protein U0K23_08915, partial [Selenomonadaceae bacterium]|nr:hypothetical protein [Selenomonadaceae bacterium]